MYLKRFALASTVVAGLVAIAGTSSSALPKPGPKRACSLDCSTATTHKVPDKDCAACVCAERSIKTHHDAKDCSKCAKDYVGPKCDVTCSAKDTRDKRTLFCQSGGDATAFSESPDNQCKCHCSAGYFTPDVFSACVKQCSPTDVKCQRDNTPETCAGAARDNRTAYCKAEGDPAAWAKTDCSCACSSGYYAPAPDAPCIKECDVKDAACHTKNAPSDCTGKNRDTRTMYCQSDGDPAAFSNSDCTCKCSSGYVTVDKYSTCVDEATTEVTLNLLQYNIQFYPGGAGPYNSPTVKAKHLVEVLTKANNGNIDVFTFDEGFSDDARAILLDGLKKAGWKYATSNVDNSGCRGVGSCHSADCYLSDGGTFIVSKHKILASDQTVYECCNGSSCYAAKGVEYVKIQKVTKNGKKTFHVFATHTQSDQGSDDISARTAQIKQFAGFMKGHNIPKGEPVLLAGDFNIDSGDSYRPHPTELAQALATLNATQPARVGAQLYTSDPTSNTWVGFDGDASAFGSFQQYFCSICNTCPKNAHDGVQCVSDCKGFSQFGPRCDKCPKQWLDYVLYSNAHQQPVLSTNKVLVLKTASPYTLEVSGKDFGENYPYMVTSDPSDHYPLLGSFTFKL